MPRPHNVIIPSLMCGIWMGYKNIGLLGAEHSWLPTITVNDNNQVLLNHQHFYDDGAKVNVMTYEGRRTRKLHEVLEKFYFSFRSYWIIQSFAEKQGVKITNFTPNSYIDAFPKQKL